MFLLVVVCCSLFLVRVELSSVSRVLFVACCLLYVVVCRRSLLVACCEVLFDVC